MNYFIFIMILVLTAFSNPLYSQSEDENSDNAATEKVSQNYQVVEEEIKKISPSKHVFILTNNNNFLNKGDFITLILNNVLVTRALVAKNADALLGIKILKIYSLDAWKKLKPDLKVQVLKGDDSSFKNGKDKNELSSLEGDESKIEKIDESIVIDEGLGLAENGARLIRTDNIISGSLGQINGLDVDGSSKGYLHYGIAWEYQLFDNFFGEIFFGQSTIAGFPSGDLDTKVYNITLRAKYTFQAPFESYLQPYAGYQVKSAKSPNAGKNDSTKSRTQAQLNSESELVDLMNENTVIFGVSILKRLVPGWFVKVDLGTDIINAGIALEF
ncbi:MAG: hypothetical protein U0T83_01980 [Bacteriovoracaceae bacterium]